MPAPRLHAARFEALRRADLQALSAVLRTTLRRLDRALERPPFNYVLHTSPFDGDDVADFYHWHLEIMPKLTKVAGFEWGSGFYINPTPPEVAAEVLRGLQTE